MLEVFGLEELPDVLEFPPVKIPREEQQIPYLREIEIDHETYSPKDVDRELVTELPPIKIDLKALMAAKQKQKE